MSYSLPSADIFTRISDASEKTRLFSDLAGSRSEMQAKKPEPAADVFVLMPYHYANERLNCKLISSAPNLPGSGLLTTTFFVGGEKYFMQSEYQLAGDQVTLITTNPLFHLQRREDYRIRIPANYKALLELVSINSQTKKHSIPIMDLSGGGCRIQVDPKFLPLKVQDHLKGHLFMPDRDPIAISGSVRHVRMENHGRGPQTCGIQFVGLTEPLKNRIIAVVMDLYRELFVGRG
ncbi:MAG: flagellar brake protein [Pseudobdellovibrionaceae bacterium]